jgi:hypothetical protein
LQFVRLEVQNKMRKQESAVMLNAMIVLEMQQVNANHVQLAIF